MEREVLGIRQGEGPYGKIVMDQALVHFMRKVLCWQIRHRQQRELLPNEKI